jgi:uncharacterized protein
VHASPLDSNYGNSVVLAVCPEFEWDDAKAAKNLLKHGITFDQAISAFRDTFAVEYPDDRMDYGEDRFIHIGMAAGQLLTVAFTERADSTRIISARRSTKYEEELYHSQNPH